MRRVYRIIPMHPGYVVNIYDIPSMSKGAVSRSAYFIETDSGTKMEKLPTSLPLDDIVRFSNTLNDEVERNNRLGKDVFDVVEVESKMALCILSS